VNTSEKVRQILLEELAKTQSRNPRYSMRAYAESLGISQSAVSEMLSGRRSITHKSAKRILEGLDKNPAEISEILEGTESEVVQTFRPLDIDAFHVVADWHYFAILSLAETETFQSSPSWIAKRLGISEKQTKDAIETLLRLELLKKDKRSGKLSPTGTQLEALSTKASPALRKANRQNIELTAKALESVPLEKRDFTAITICVDPRRLDEAQKLIKSFRRKFSSIMESGPKKEVYKLCIQLFPLSK